MLSARALANISDDITELYSQLESEIKKDMFRRLNRLQKVTDATIWQAEILKETGALKNNINKLVSKYNDKARGVLKDLFYSAMDQAKDNDLKYYAFAGRSMSASQKQKLNTSIDRLYNAEVINKTFARQQEQLEKLYNDVTRLTLTVADATEKEFLKQCNNAYMKVTSGAFSWNNSYKDAINAQARAAYADAAVNLANNGVKTIIYNYSGKAVEYSIEAATKMNVLTGVNLAASQQTLENAAALGNDLVEVSAHIGARDVDRPGKPWANHAAFQGRVFCLNGERDYIDGDGNRKHAFNFQESCGLGEPDGICGINCRHSYYPYFEGSPLLYSKGELDEMKEQTVRLDGREISPYEAEQNLRLCERNIRAYKAQAQALELTGNTDNPKYQKARENIYKWQNNARHIVDETGIKRKYINEYIGTPNGVQPTGLKPTYAKAIKEFEKTPELNHTAQMLATNNVRPLNVEKLKTNLTSPQIIKKLGGGDMTGGSCSSLAFAYSANYGGLDVTDYRGGGSRKVFATTSNIVEIANLPKVKSAVVTTSNDIKAVFNLLDTITDLNKPYYLATGRHAAIVRKTSKGFEYLELQSKADNGFKELTKEKLKKRFKAREKGVILHDTILIECESLAKNKDFKKLMKYINTNPKAQLKGLLGGEK